MTVFFWIAGFVLLVLFVSCLVALGNWTSHVTDTIEVQGEILAQNKMDHIALTERIGKLENRVVQLEEFCNASK